MTNEEILKLLLNKFERFEKRQDEIVDEVKALRSDVNRLESKVDANYKELSGKIKELSGKIDANYKDLLDKVSSVAIAIVDIDNTIDILTKEFKANRQFTQGAIHDVQVRVLHLEKEFANIKLKLEQLDRAS